MISSATVSHVTQGPKRCSYYNREMHADAGNPKGHQYLDFFENFISSKVATAKNYLLGIVTS